MADLVDRVAVEEAAARRLARLSERHRRELQGLLGEPPNAANVPGTFWDKVQRDQEEELAALLAMIWLMSATQHGFGHDAAAIPSAMAAAGRARATAAGYVETSIQRLPLALDDLFLVFGPERSANLAVTETTWAIVQGGEAAMRATSGVSQQDEWRTENDQTVCAICRPLNREPRQSWEYRYPSGPPAHPNCRCWIEYANQVNP